MVNTPDVLGLVIKKAREAKSIRAETLAEQLDISTRHLSAIENGASKPSYNVLCQVIRLLDIPPTTVFFPEQHSDTDTEITRSQVIAAIRNCDGTTLKMIHAMLVSNGTIANTP